MAGTTITIAQKAGDRRRVQLNEPIKQLGEYIVPRRLHKEVTAETTVVVKEE